MHPVLFQIGSITIYTYGCLQRLDFWLDFGSLTGKLRELA